MSFQELIQSLQGAKKELQRPERLSLEERARSCEKIALDLSSGEIRLMDINADLFSRVFYDEQIQQPGAQAFSQAAQELGTGSSAQNFPLGVMSLQVSSPFFFRLACERIAPALAAGNTLLWSVSESQKKLALEIEKLVHQSGFPSACLQILDRSPEADSFLAQHPGIRAVNIFDSSLEASTLGGPTWSEKKYQIHRGGKSTALVLADADLDQAVSGILRAVQEGQGSSSWNISRVIVIDSVEEAFTEKLRTALSHLTLQLAETTKERKNFWVQKFQSQQARLINAESPLGFLENVSNCSEEHQIELGAPVVFVMSVKYPVDMQKWVNNLPNALGVQIWGSEEKSLKLASKLEAGRIWLNGWLEKDENLFFGVKSSVFGNLNPQVFGGAYSETRKIDGIPSK